MKTLPNGISNFQELITKDYYYVDKTKYIRVLESTNPVIKYLKPRRFGKTLFTSMMYYYYDINSKDLYEELFKGTDIYYNPTNEKNTYYILKLDFSGMSIDDNDVKSIQHAFNKCLQVGIEEFNIHYKLDVPFDINTLPADNLKDFMIYANRMGLKNKVYVIIDEYDNFTNALLGTNIENFKNILTDGGFVKAFYAALKSARNSIVARVFITGVSSISLDAMTSGFNIGVNITVDERYDAMTALTHEEVKDIIKNVVNEDIQDKVFKEMVDNYDGYIFSDNMISTFNPTLAMYYLSNYQEFGKPPKNLMDPNIFSSTTPIESVMKLDNNNFYVDILNNILNYNEITGELKYQFDLKTKIKPNDITSLLFYFGYLTIKDYDEEDREYTYRIPNKVMENLFIECFMNILNDAEIFDDYSALKDAIKSLQDYGDIEPLLKEIKENIKNNGNRIHLNFNEKHIQLIIYTLIYSSKKFYVYSEYEVSNGYVDLYLKKKENKSNYDIMIELKYIKKEDFNDKKLKEKIEEGTNQIEKYSQDDRIDKNNLKKYVIVFSDDKYTVKSV